MSNLQKPYDLLFRHTLSNDVALKDFFRIHLPPKILQRIDLKTLKPTKQSYVPQELRELHSDLVCHCRIDGKNVILYTLCEHQSQASWIMPLRFIKYQAALIEDYLNGKPTGTPWPMLLSVCFYHGKQSPYPYPTNVYDYFEEPKLAQQVGTFQHFHLIDLTLKDLPEIKNHASLEVMERILKYSRERDFLNDLTAILEECNDTWLSLQSPLGEEYWYAIYLVAVQVAKQHGNTEEEVANLFADKLNLSLNTQTIMSIRQMLQQEAKQEGIKLGVRKGMQEGKKAGLQEGKRAALLIVAKRLLQQGLSLNQIALATGLSHEEMQRLI